MTTASTVAALHDNHMPYLHRRAAALILQLAEHPHEDGWALLREEPAAVVHMAAIALQATAAELAQQQNTSILAILERSGIRTCATNACGHRLPTVDTGAITGHL
ncbi:hypothetical protein [Nocardia sp. alder85J]|uniref:hypothetical protein n=1 Tax=Nocardia sp. alder85J TaxID=2862949 RepID=UPI001CD6E58B|nr:hypothetical protein [Nocardia sp. alder85J]MCX4097006.1 hypothetical protein [Nocardia sp. alder85J]